MRRPARAVLLVTTFAFALGVSARARAADQAPPDAAAVAAREHYQKGTSFYDLGKYNDAITEFEAAYEIKNDPALLYNLAQSHRLAGNADQALHFYRTYLRYVPHPANRVEIDDRIKQLEASLAQKSPAPVATPSQPSATTPPPSTEPAPPAAVPAAPTPPPSIAEPTPGAPPPGAEPMPPTTEAAPVLTSSPSPPPSNEARAQQLRRYALYGYIGSAALVTIGLIEGARAASASSELESDAKAGKQFDPSVQSRGQSAQGTEAAFVIVGLLAAGGSTALYLYGNHLEHQVSLTPIASATGVGGLLRVTF